MKFKLSTSSLVTAACLASTAQMAHATDVFRLEGFGAIWRSLLWPEAWRGSLNRI
jgi:hypothetical protein